MHLTRPFFCAIAILAVTTACGGTSSPNEQTPTASATPQTPAQAAAQAAEQLQKMGQQQAATAVAFESLVALLPTVAGWEKGTPRGENYSMGVTMSRGQVSYTKGDKEIDLEIVDTALNQMVLAPLSMYMVANYSMRTSEGYHKGISINGHPGWEEWTNEPKDGKVTVIVANRFMVSADGSDLESIEQVRAVVQAVDLAKLATLK